MPFNNWSFKSHVSRHSCAVGKILFPVSWFAGMPPSVAYSYITLLAYNLKRLIVMILEIGIVIDIFFGPFFASSSSCFCFSSFLNNFEHRLLYGSVLCSMWNNSPKNMKDRLEGGWVEGEKGLHSHVTGKMLHLCILAAVEQRSFTGKCLLPFVDEDFSQLKVKAMRLCCVGCRDPCTCHSAFVFLGIFLFHLLIITGIQKTGSDLWWIHTWRVHGRRCPRRLWYFSKTFQKGSQSLPAY